MPTYLGVDESGTLNYSLYSTFQLTTLDNQVIINEENAHDTQDFINKRLAAVKNQRTAGEMEDLALIIGKSHI